MASGQKEPHEQRPGGWRADELQLIILFSVVRSGQPNRLSHGCQIVQNHCKKFKLYPEVLCKDWNRGEVEGGRRGRTVRFGFYKGPLATV